MKGKSLFSNLIRACFQAFGSLPDGRVDEGITGVQIVLDCVNYWKKCSAIPSAYVMAELLVSSTSLWAFAFF